MTDFIKAGDLIDMSMLHSGRSLRFLVVLVVIVLSACNAGGGDDGASTGVAPSEPGVTVSRAILGPLEGADFEVFKYPDLEAPVSTGVTSGGRFDEIGAISIPVDLIELDALYLIRVRGGADHDIEDDGIQDASPTNNKGIIHAFIGGRALDSGLSVVSIVSELVYQRARAFVDQGLSVAELKDILDKFAERVLKRDLNNDGMISLEDVVHWDPVTNKDALTQDFDQIIRPAILQIHEGQLPIEAALSISGPVLSEIELPQQPRELATSNNIAIAAADASELYVVDFSDTYNPELLATIAVEGDIQSVAISGEIALVGVEHIVYTNEGEEVFRRVLAFDISDSRSPELISTLNISEEPSSVVLRDSILIVSTEPDIQLFDFSDPASPKLLASLPAIDDAGNISLLGNYAYISDTSHLQIIDISVPENPNLVRTIETPIFPLNTVFQGDYAYVVTAPHPFIEEARPQLLVLDISQPEEAFIATRLELKDAVRALISDGILYVSERDHGLTAFDISDPLSPQVISSYDTSEYSLLRMAELGPHLLIARSDRSLMVYDPYDQVHGESFTSLDRVEANGGLHVDGDFLYFSRFGEMGSMELVVASLGEDGEIKELGATVSDCVAAQFQVMGETLVVSDDRAKLCTFNISDPAQPEYLGSLSINSGPYAAISSLAVSNNIAFVSTLFDGRVTSIDLSDPASPEVLGSLALGYLATDIAIKDDRLFVVLNASAGQSSDLGMLSVISISSPDALSVVGDIHIPRDSYAIEILGDTALVAYAGAPSGGGSAQLVDISVPEQPVVLENVALGEMVYDIKVANERFYAADLLGYMYEVAVVEGKTRIESFVQLGNGIAGVYASDTIFATIDACEDMDSGSFNYGFLRCDSSRYPRYVRTKRLPFDASR